MGPERMTSPTQQTEAPPPPPALHRRVRRGVRYRSNWVQLVRFGVVGGSGYIVNLAVFAALVEGAGVNHLVASTVAFSVAVLNNFWLNRHWTFQARAGHAGFQASRYFAVSVVAFLVGLGLLALFVDVLGLPELLSQAAAIVIATPVNFAGNKVWTFDRHKGRS